jgi:hypothetical protein
MVFSLEGGVMAVDADTRLTAGAAGVRDEG